MTGGGRVEYGSRVVIFQLEHSAGVTREGGPGLIGRCGRVLCLMRTGLVALVELDEAFGGVRRWSVNRNDLTPAVVDEGCFVAPVGMGELRLGVTGPDDILIRHAVWPKEDTGLCGIKVRRLNEYVLPFVSAAFGACPDCRKLTSAEEELPVPYLLP
ncbi:hypothetical protein [Nonomuraea insulae]|uniref:Uncharacterized protein n=1 Tax=Nonomuraea insulae TaxID=1616787 RepID=A0ABW1CUZ3_9ACTN